MKRLLERISWLTRKINFEIELLNLLLHNGNDSWGFRLFTLNINYRKYSLLAFKFRLPNKTNIRQFTIDDWDILFVRYFLWKILNNLSESIMWRGQYNNTTKWEKFQLNIYKKLFN